MVHMYQLMYNVDSSVGASRSWSVPSWMTLALNATRLQRSSIAPMHADIPKDYQNTALNICTDTIASIGDRTAIKNGTNIINDTVPQSTRHKLLTTVLCLPHRISAKHPHRG